MTLNDYRDEAARFLEAIGADKNDTPQILDWLDDELALLEQSINDKPKLRHQIYDMLFLLFELAARHDLDLDTEWIQGRQRKQSKYLNGRQQ